MGAARRQLALDVSEGAREDKGLQDAVYRVAHVLYAVHPGQQVNDLMDENAL